MPEIEKLLENMKITHVNHLPIVAAFCRRIGLVQTINRCVPSKMEVDVGTIIQAMVLDTLSGRSPLYRLEDFFKHQDTELLLGRTLSSSMFNDTSVGRAMDAIYEAGASNLFSAVAFQACRRFPLDMSKVHFDTTSVNVWGEYDQCKPDSEMLDITRGHSKDHRPDLKQFLIKMLCVGRNIPILGGCEDGNTSDKTLNNALLNRISDHMAKHGLAPGAFLYVADAAMVTEDNLSAIGENIFVSRLPFTYNETSRVVAQAEIENSWEQVGTLNQTPPTDKRPAAQYRVAEKTVTLYKKEYRAVVVHSSAYDKRRQKRIEREIKNSETSLLKLIGQETKREFFCRADAEQAAARLRESGNELHRLEISSKEKVRNVRGRPKKNQPQKVASVRYVLEAKVLQNTEQIERKQREAGCFVLLSNVPLQGDAAQTGADLLRAYKEQYGIERNFSFLKDPLIVNDTFLKKPQRIEVLGSILLMALLVWNLIEHVLRQYVSANNVDLPGWDNKQTRRPTAFMMSTKFSGLQIVRIGGANCHLAMPLTNVQRLYLRALGLTEHHLLAPAPILNNG
ncbi:MAG TPA: IS1634 family transposase [Nitrospirota bacterium]|nr:IS1634 family transposase [Nitrospirota bacterium]